MSVKSVVERNCGNNSGEWRVPVLTPHHTLLHHHQLFNCYSLLTPNIRLSKLICESISTVVAHLILVLFSEPRQMITISLRENVRYLSDRSDWTVNIL